MPKFPIMRRITTETSTAVIQSKLYYQSLVMSETVSDNGPCFKCFEFKDFVKSYGIKHTSIRPYYHQANGQVE